MQYQRFGNSYLIRLLPGEEIFSSLMDFAQKEKITLASVSGIGAVNHVKMGLFDIASQKYNAVIKDEALEITSLVGNISIMDSKSYLHLHITVSDAKMQVFGGHLNEGIISATAEIIVHTIEGAVERSFDCSVGINVFDFEKKVQG